MPHIPTMFKWRSWNIKAYENFYSFYITYTISNTWTNTENRNFFCISIRQYLASMIKQIHKQTKKIHFLHFDYKR